VNIQVRSECVSVERGKGIPKEREEGRSPEV
jgi:hypothetical protein